MSHWIEENLDTPLRQVLPHFQDSILYRTSYFGVRAIKSPMDAWIYQQIMFETKPDVIIEVGTSSGGGTLYLAHLCDLLGKGKVVGIDITLDTVPQVVRSHSRITLIEGDACENFEAVKSLVSGNDRVLIIEDSSHTYENTLNVLRCYSSLVRPGDYFIVEDGICHHGLDTGPNPGPYEAIEAFTKENTDFVIDRSREQFLITWNPKGYLRRKSLHQRLHSPPPHERIRKEGLTKQKVKRFINLITPPILISVARRLLR